MLQIREEDVIERLNNMKWNLTTTIITRMLTSNIENIVILL